MTLKIVSWNCNGIQKNGKLLKFLQRTYLKRKPNEIFLASLQETKLNVLTNDIKKVLEYYSLNHHFQPAEDRSGGLLTIWSEEEGILRESNKTCIITEFPNLNLYLINTYIRTENYVQWCTQLLNSVRSIKPEGKIVMMGDTNGYEDPTRDRIGKTLKSSDIHPKVYNRLKPVLEDLNLEDLAVKLNVLKPTHYCKATGTQCRLDYIFTNGFFTDSNIVIHEIDLSDHAMVEAKLEENDIETGPGVWRLNNNILPANFGFIHDFLNQADDNPANYDATKQKLQDHLRNICLTKSILEKQYQAHLQQCLMSPESDLNEIKDLIEEAEHKTCKENLKTVEKCFQHVADGKPQQVKKWVNQIRPKVLIKELKKREAVTNNTNEIIEELKQFYEKLYTAEEVDNLKRFQILRYYRRKITEREISELERPITIYDVECAISKLRSNTSPGPDELTAELYKTHRSSFAKVLLPVFQGALDGKNLPKSFSTSIISLIPKENGLKSAKDFRPLSLINLDQKILSHVLASRIKKIEALVGNDQFAYVKDGNIHRAIWDMKQRMSENSENWCLVGIDCTKAFDRVDRKFMLQVLRKMAFPANFVNLVENIYRNTTAYLKINGHLTSKLKMTRGVRQGCPLSALLFIITLEPLMEALRTHNWFTHQAERRVIAYADDINIFVHEDDLQILFDKMQAFCDGTQFQINRDKSAILCRKNLTNMKTSSKAKVLGVHLGFNEEADIENHKKIRKILEEGRKYFSKHMNLHAKAVIMKTFILPKLLHILRHIRIDSGIIQQFKEFSKCALWGSGKKSLIALEFLERITENGGIGWPNFLLEITAGKIKDIYSIHESKDVVSRNLLIELWSRNCKFRSDLRKEFSQVNVNIKDISEQKLETSLELIPNQIHREIYQLLLKKNRWDYRWENRTKNSSHRYGITTQILESNGAWLWRQKELKAVEKNCFYKMMLNCFRDKKIL